MQYLLQKLLGLPSLATAPAYRLIGGPSVLLLLWLSSFWHVLKVAFHPDIPAHHSAGTIRK